MDDVVLALQFRVLPAKSCRHFHFPNEQLWRIVTPLADDVNILFQSYFMTWFDRSQRLGSSPSNTSSCHFSLESSGLAFVAPPAATLRLHGLRRSITRDTARLWRYANRAAP